MELYKWQKLPSLTFYIEFSSKFVREGLNLALLKDKQFSLNTILFETRHVNTVQKIWQ